MSALLSTSLFIEYDSAALRPDVWSVAKVTAPGGAHTHLRVRRQPPSQVIILHKSRRERPVPAGGTRDERLEPKRWLAHFSKLTRPYNMSIGRVLRCWTRLFPQNRV